MAIKHFKTAEFDAAVAAATEHTDFGDAHGRGTDYRRYAGSSSAFRI